MEGWLESGGGGVGEGGAGGEVGVGEGGGGGEGEGVGGGGEEDLGGQEGRWCRARGFGKGLRRPWS